MSLFPLLIENAVRAALLEDLGHGHDITTDSLIDKSEIATGTLRARESGVLAGIVPALSAFMHTDPEFEITVYKSDGEEIEAGDDIATIEGPAGALLTAERTALNFVSHMSGIATLTRHYVDAVEGTDAQIVCTRKTLPGLRAFQKYSVRMGGGQNHRFGLDDAVLIKDNHIALVGDIEAALELAAQNAGHLVKIEIEVDTLEQLQQVLDFNEEGVRGADVVMLDNFLPADLKKAVKLAEGKIITEASGGITLENVRAIAETGVNLISVGALTHSVRALDIGLDVDG